MKSSIVGGQLVSCPADGVAPGTAADTASDRPLICAAQRIDAVTLFYLTEAQWSHNGGACVHASTAIQARHGGPDSNKINR